MAALGLTVSVLTVGAAYAEPEQRPTAAQIEKAYHALEKANDKINGLDVRIEDTQTDIDELSQAISSQIADFDAKRTVLGASIVQQQMDAPLGPTVNLLGSNDAREFLDGLSTVQSLNSTQASAIEQVSREAERLKNRRAQLEDRRSELAALKRKADSQRAGLESDYKKLKATAARLDAAERARLNPPAVTTASPQVRDEAAQEVKTAVAEGSASGRGAAAINFAMAQLGDPYVYGGTGPDGWDCSGLTQAAWAAAGVSLPRVVGPQYAAIQHIPMSALQPGDLVFYPNMAHVGIYIGGGRTIHAPRPGRSVEIAGMYGYTLAGRVG